MEVRSLPLHGSPQVNVDVINMYIYIDIYMKEKIRILPVVLFLTFFYQDKIYMQSVIIHSANGGKGGEECKFKIS
jgi:hypothetical protein